MDLEKQGKEIVEGKRKKKESEKERGT